MRVSNPTDTEQIKDVFQQLFTAWSEGDAVKFADQFTDHVDYITFNGQHIKGKREVETIHDQLFTGILKGSKMKGEVTDIRFLNEETAIAYCIGNTKMKWQKNFSEKRSSINTNVLSKESGSWKITSFHNCRIKKPSAILKLLTKTK
ncbi:SgcJ/EcaC family oxidoreductase [Halobacillus rhizosphaerae]|uniref:SgcJ/EcaC family oxidoreductase n=1 Tax=Halobacillus rhizosphaerae TaxID=3064889 RepID=UPI00398B41FC